MHGLHILYDIRNSLILMQLMMLTRLSIMCQYFVDLIFIYHLRLFLCCLLLHCIHIKINGDTSSHGCALLSEIT